MVFENLTLIELHMEGSRFGPNFGGDDEDEASEMGPREEGAGGMSPILPVLALLVLAVGAAVAVRRFRSDDGDGGIESESDQITIEHAAES